MPAPTFMNLQGPYTGAPSPAANTRLLQPQVPPGVQFGGRPTRPRIAPFEEYRRRYGTPAGGGTDTSFSQSARPQRVNVDRPRLSDFGAPSREGIGEARERLERTRAEYDDPTSSAAFQNLMSLATERTTAFEESQTREAQEIAARRGFVGGGADVAARAASDKARALAEAGFAGAAQIREQAAAIYGEDVGAYTSLLTEHQRALSSRNLAYADALAQAARLQAELDARLEAGRLDQRQYELESARLAEEARQFDTTTAQLDRAAARGAFESDRDYFLNLSRVGTPPGPSGSPVSGGRPRAAASPGILGAPGAPPAPVGPFRSPNVFTPFAGGFR